MIHDYCIKRIWGDYYVVYKTKNLNRHIALPDICIYHKSNDRREDWYVDIYNSNRLFSRLLSAYICIDVLPISDCNIEEVIVKCGHKDILEMLENINAQ